MMSKSCVVRSAPSVSYTSQRNRERHWMIKPSPAPAQFVAPSNLNNDPCGCIVWLSLSLPLKTTATYSEAGVGAESALAQHLASAE